MLMAESWQVGINIHLGAGIKPSSGLHNALHSGIFGIGRLCYLSTKRPMEKMSADATCYVYLINGNVINTIIRRHEIKYNHLKKIYNFGLVAR